MEKSTIIPKRAGVYPTVSMKSLKLRWKKPKEEEKQSADGKTKHRNSILILDKSAITLQIYLKLIYIRLMIPRQIIPAIEKLRDKFPVITLTGARQTGKTTLLKFLYKDLPYINLEDVDNRLLAEEDPRGFLNNFPKGAVIDEVQQVPQLFSYIQQVVDHNPVHFALFRLTKFPIDGKDNAIIGRQDCHF